jgi:hypothetical protein
MVDKRQDGTVTILEALVKEVRHEGHSKVGGGADKERLYD